MVEMGKVDPAATTQRPPMRVGIAGLSHGHVNWVFQRAQPDDIEIVGFAEADQEIAERYRTRYNIAPHLPFDRLETMLDMAKPTAVMAFGSIYDHCAVVEACAPRRARGGHHR